jgi:uncharacterized membrane protein YdjX (TVP38/TMEM64 family)
MKKLLIITGVLLALACYYFFLAEHLTFAALKSYQRTLQAFVNDHYILTVLAYISSYAAAVVLSLPVATLFTILGGSLFGVIWGAFYAVIGATIGATGAFLAVRYLFGSYLQRRYREHLEILNRELDVRGAFYLLSLRFFAVIPFFVLNILAGLTAISLRTFIVTTALGIIPAALVFAYAGQSLASLESPKDILSTKVIVAFILLGLLALVPVLFRKREKA